MVPTKNTYANFLPPARLLGQWTNSELASSILKDEKSGARSDDTLESLRIHEVSNPTVTDIAERNKDTLALLVEPQAKKKSASEF